MPQLHCYVSDSIAEKLQNKAEQAHISISKYLADLVRQDVASELPDDFFELFGTWKGEPLTRDDQGKYEQRLEFK